LSLSRLANKYLLGNIRARIFHFARFYVYSKSVLRPQNARKALSLTMKRLLVFSVLAFFCTAFAAAPQSSKSDEAGRILALEKAWNHALEEKDTKALDMLLGPTLISVDIDGSVQSKGEFLASIKAPDYQPSQAVTEQTSVEVYGNSAVVVGIFRIKGMEKGKPYLHRERFVDTWIKINGTWQCVATTATLITAKQPAEQ
jgi:ketosteroid isomerase-like protein